eukprot:4472769-Pleurochrysis_carterae.AAC.1
MKGPRGAISANHHPFPHAVDSILEVRAAGFRSQTPRAQAIYQCDRTAPNLTDDSKIRQGLVVENDCFPPTN